MNNKEQTVSTTFLPWKQKIGKQSFGRRVFVKRIFLAGLFMQIPLKKAFQSEGITASIPYKTNPHILNENQRSIVHIVQQHLFPNDGDSPDADQINATEYLIWVLSDPRKDPADIKYIIDGIGWVEETADEEYGKAFLELEEIEMRTVMAFIAEEGWGTSWLSIILGYIFEALVTDPLYGGNTDEAGWKWLSYFPGYPRPKEDLLYGNILKTVNEQ